MAKKEPTLVVLAAGIGSRYGGLKQMDPVGPGDQTLIDYSVYDAGKAGFRRIVVVVKADILEDFQRLVSSRWPGCFEVSHVLQDVGQVPPEIPPFSSRRKPWGTGQALLAAASHVDGPFASVNADDFYGREAFQRIYEFLRNVQPDSMDFAMVGFRLGETLSPHGTVSRALCEIGKDGFLRSLREIKAIEALEEGARYRDHAGGLRMLTGRELVSLNFWGFTLGVLPRLETQFSRFLQSVRNTDRESTAEFYLPEAVSDLISSGQARVKVLESSQRWLGITHREDLESVREGIAEKTQSGEYPESLWDR